MGGFFIYEILLDCQLRRLLWKNVNIWEAVSALFFLVQVAQSAAEMYGNFRGCAVKTAVAHSF